MRNILRMTKKGCIAVFWTSAFLAFLTIITGDLGLPKLNYSMLRLGVVMVVSLVLFTWIHALVQNLYPDKENPDKVPSKLKVMIFAEMVFTGLTFIGIITTQFVTVLLVREFPITYFEIGLYILGAIGILAITLRLWRRSESKRVGIRLPMDDI